MVLKDPKWQLGSKRIKTCIKYVLNCIKIDEKKSVLNRNVSKRIKCGIKCVSKIILKNVSKNASKRIKFVFQVH